MILILKSSTANRVLFWCLFPLLLRTSGNKQWNNLCERINSSPLQSIHYSLCISGLLLTWCRQLCPQKRHINLGFRCHEALAETILLKIVFNAQFWDAAAAELVETTWGWISNHTLSKEWDESIYPIPNFNSCTTTIIYATAGYMAIGAWKHYIDAIMGAMASQITSLAIFYSTVYSGADQRKHQGPRHWPLCGEFTVTGEVPARRVSNAETISIWWSHHETGRVAMGPF